MHVAVVASTGAMPPSVPEKLYLNEGSLTDVLFAYSPRNEARRAVLFEWKTEPVYDQNPCEGKILRVPAGTLKGDLIARMNGDIWWESPISCDTPERVAHKLDSWEVLVRSVSLRPEESDLVPYFACHALDEPLLEIYEGAGMHRSVAKILQTIHVGLEVFLVSQARLEERPVFLDDRGKVGEIGEVDEPLIDNGAVALLGLLALALTPFLDSPGRAALVDPLRTELLRAPNRR